MKDTIYRADAIETVRNRLQSLESYASDVYRRGLYEAQDIIEALPSAEAEPSLKAIKRQIDEHWYFDPSSAEAVQGYTEWLEKIIVKEAIVWLCEDTTDREWCEKNCNYASIQAECLRHLYEVSKGGDDE